ncbi:hypothetical protein PTKU64_89270 [Paraburkholderia terrae]|uniref:Uncharacterized protein n=1 Tax=Paraburkholderia terrae TaxID=311230 RepID=A0ABM7UBK0_9BURK|nr:hypothetical protein PTKU64_89270 [Paraburkholderia terrae]BDC45549.1 hypothetical protein PTKU15_88460 [Paraburkholderia terrae]
MILLKRKPTRTIDVGRAECNAYAGSCVGASERVRLRTGRNLRFYGCLTLPRSREIEYFSSTERRLRHAFSASSRIAVST